MECWLNQKNPKEFIHFGPNNDVDDQLDFFSNGISNCPNKMIPVSNGFIKFIWLLAPVFVFSNKDIYVWHNNIISFIK